MSRRLAVAECRERWRTRPRVHSPVESCEAYEHELLQPAEWDCDSGTGKGRSAWSSSGMASHPGASSDASRNVPRGRPDDLQPPPGGELEKPGDALREAALKGPACPAGNPTTAPLSSAPIARYPPRML